MPRYRLAAASAGLTVLCLAVGGPTARAASGAATAPPSPLCPASTASSANGKVIAGYTQTSLAAGLRYQVNSPGLLPIGDAQVGTIDETDVPFARTTVDSGPVIDALGAPAYPGDTLARFGSVLGQFGAPGVPNPPIVAESNFPSSPTYGTSATFNKPATPGAGAFTASSTASATAATAQATSAAVSLAQVQGGSAPVSGGSADTSAAADIGATCVDSSAHADTGPITIAGIIQIQDVTGNAFARSDGSKGVPTATLTVGHVTVAGQDAYIDDTGVHLVSQPGLGGSVIQAASAALQKALTSSGLTVRVVSPVITTAGAMASADSGGLVVTEVQTLPGVTAAQVPPIPLQVILEYGEASATADATTAPAPGTLSPPTTAPVPTALPLTGPPPVASGGSLTSGGLGPEPAAAGVPVTSSGAPVITGTGPASTETFSAAPAAATSSLGHSAPIGWILVGILAAVTLIAPMLGYARWQLLEGRI
jgi:hypothetical protein